MAPFKKDKKTDESTQTQAQTAETEHKTAKELRADGEALARRTFGHVFQDSTLPDLAHMLPAFDRDEIKLGQLLGMGSFGVVFEVKGFQLDQDRQRDDKLHPRERKFLSKHARRDNGDARYAVKKLTQQAISDPVRHKYAQAVLDMAIETRLLCNLDDHPHICKLRAVSASRDPYTPEYLLILDRLYDTLEMRMYKWKRQFQKYRGMSTKWLLDRTGMKMTSLRHKQLVSGVQLCAALDFLHQRKIIFRDLKGENVGYDVRDDIKLFDFGLAKELKSDKRLQDGSGMYHLTGLTGSPRYMAPEVANSQPYNETCDSYSFAILFYEMYSFRTPFDRYTMDQMHKTVWNEPHKRPFKPSKWPESIRQMLKRSWTPDHAQRWPIVRIMEVLHAESLKLAVAAAGEDGGVSNAMTATALPSNKIANHDELRLAFMRRKSTFVFRGRSSSNGSSSSDEETGKHRRHMDNAPDSPGHKMTYTASSGEEEVAIEVNDDGHVAIGQEGDDDPDDALRVSCRGRVGTNEKKQASMPYLETGMSHDAEDDLDYLFEAESHVALHAVDSLDDTEDPVSVTAALENARHLVMAASPQ